MTCNELFQALVLGLIEGGTEFLPVSSTGHLLLLGHFLGFEVDRQDLRGPDPARRDPGASCRSISRGCGRSRRRCPTIRTRAASSSASLIAFLPAAVIGAVLHGFIKDVLFNPWIVCCTLIAGGFVLLVIDELPLERTAARTRRASRCRCTSRSA